MLFCFKRIKSDDVKIPGVYPGIFELKIKFHMFCIIQLF